MFRYRAFEISIGCAHAAVSIFTGNIYSITGMIHVSALSEKKMPLNVKLTIKSKKERFQKTYN